MCRFGLRTPDKAEIGHFTLLCCRGRQRNALKTFYNARAQPRFFFFFLARAFCFVVCFCFYFCLAKRYTVGQEEIIMLDIKPTSHTGVLLSSSSAKGDYIVLEMIDGNVSM